MNKKILSIFVMVMALSLLGVSCNKKTTDPTNNSTSSGSSSGSLTSAAMLTINGNNSGSPQSVSLNANAGTTAVDILKPVTLVGWNENITSTSTITYTVSSVKVHDAGTSSLTADQIIDNKYFIASANTSDATKCDLKISKDNVVDLNNNVIGNDGGGTAYNATFEIIVTETAEGYAPTYFKVYAKITAHTSNI